MLPTLTVLAGVAAIAYFFYQNKTETLIPASSTKKGNEAKVTKSMPSERKKSKKSKSSKSQKEKRKRGTKDPSSRASISSGIPSPAAAVPKEESKPPVETKISSTASVVGTVSEKAPPPTVEATPESTTTVAAPEKATPVSLSAPLENKQQPSFNTTVTDSPATVAQGAPFLLIPSQPIIVQQLPANQSQQSPSATELDIRTATEKTSDTSTVSEDTATSGKKKKKKKKSKKKDGSKKKTKKKGSHKKKPKNITHDEFDERLTSLKVQKLKSELEKQQQAMAGTDSATPVSPPVAAGNAPVLATPTSPATAVEQQQQQQFPPFGLPPAQGNVYLVASLLQPQQQFIQQHTPSVQHPPPVVQPQSTQLPPPEQQPPATVAPVSEKKNVSLVAEPTQHMDPVDESTQPPHQSPMAPPNAVAQPEPSSTMAPPPSAQPPFTQQQSLGQPEPLQQQPSPSHSLIGQSPNQKSSSGTWSGTESADASESPAPKKKKGSKKKKKKNKKLTPATPKKKSKKKDGGPSQMIEDKQKLAKIEKLRQAVAQEKEKLDIETGKIIGEMGPSIQDKNGNDDKSNKKLAKIDGSQSEGDTTGTTDESFTNTEEEENKSAEKKKKKKSKQKKKRKHHSDN